MRAFPAVADRPSRIGAVIELDPETPFQVDVVQGATLIDVSWDAVAWIAPVMMGIAADAGAGVFLAFEGQFVEPGASSFDQDHWSEVERSQVAAIDDIYDAQRGGWQPRSIARPSADRRDTVCTVFLWADRVDSLQEAATRTAKLRRASWAQNPASAVAERILSALPGSLGGKSNEISVAQTADVFRIEIPASLLEQVGPELIAIAMEFGLQYVDQEAGILFPDD